MQLSRRNVVFFKKSFKISNLLSSKCHVYNYSLELKLSSDVPISYSIIVRIL